MPHSTYFADRMGHAVIEPRGEFEAGSFQSFTLTYTAGYFGIDDTGSLKIVHRFASDMGRPQFTEPKGWNYTTVEASNGAVLEVQYDGKRNIRPWDKTLFIRIVRGFLREGDRIIVRFGDRRQGSPGMRVQTFHEPTFEFRVLVDAWATYEYVELPEQPYVSIVARSAGALQMRAADAAQGRPAVQTRLQGRRRVGQSVALRRCDVYAEAQSAGRGFAGDAERGAGRIHESHRRPGLPADAISSSKCSTLPASVRASATRCASPPKQRCCLTGPTCTASPRKRSAPTPRAS